MAGRILEKEVVVNAPAEAAWDAWTTAEGIVRFLAPAVSALEIRPNGPYEVFFNPQDPPGLRGSEGCRILSYVPYRMLSFTWGAPPDFPVARREIAQWVVLNFEPFAEGRTKVKLTELGFKDGEEGEGVYRYFDRAWEVVLRRLARSFELGPIDWSDPWRPPE